MNAVLSLPAFSSGSGSSLDPRLSALLSRIVAELRLSAELAARIQIVARRIADGAGSDAVETSHLLEAVQFCTLQADRSTWPEGCLAGSAA